VDPPELTQESSAADAVGAATIAIAAAPIANSGVMRFSLIRTIVSLLT
jgi:hypothetical protein